VALHFLTSLCESEVSRELAGQRIWQPCAMSSWHDSDLESLEALVCALNSDESSNRLTILF